jgi:hypothetical protein
METTGIAEAGKFISLEQFFAAMDRIAAEAAERQKEAAEEFKELKRLHAETERAHKETERVMKEVGEKQKKNEKAIKRLSLNVGGLNSSMGGLVETLVAARLSRKFRQYHIRNVLQRISVIDETGRLRTDIDILLTNTGCAIAVEVKRILKKHDVDEHLERMELIRRYPPEYMVNPSGKKLLGAVAGGTVAREVRKYAHERGLFVLELAGESVRMARTPEGFTPREW